MKKTAIHRILWRPPFVLALAIVLFSPLSNLASADMSLKSKLTMKKNFGPEIILDQALMKVNMPINIANMPGPWKNAKFKALAVVYFMDAANEPVGYASSEGGLAIGTLLDVALANGSYSGTVVIPIKTAAGTITGKTCCTTILIAELGDQRMFIGASRGGTAPNACDGFFNTDIAPGTIIDF